MTVMKLVSWGANQYGQLAHAGWPVTEQCEVPQTCDTTGLPEGIADNIVQICGGGGHTLLLDTLGQVWACGLNNKGQCGQKPQALTAPGNLLRPWHLVNLGGGIQIVHIAAGWEHTLALTSDHILLGWGNNSHGQLGPMQCDATYEPVEVARGVLHMSAGLRHSAWVTEDHKLKISGALKNLQTDLPDYLKCYKVSCGQRHILALVSAEGAEEGQIWSVGDNRYGQLGIHNQNSIQNLSLAHCLSEYRFSQLSCGWSHAVALTSDGNVVCWGRNLYGQLGTPPKAQDSQQTPIDWNLSTEINVGGKAVQLALGSEHTLVRLDSGTVLSCGWNEHGNCGTGDLIDCHTPKTILREAKLIGSGAAHCFAVV